MPWHLSPNDDACPLGESWAVRQDDNDKLMGCHPTRKDALAQVAALNAGENLSGRTVGQHAKRVAAMRALADLDLRPSDSMVKEAEKGLGWRDEFGRGGTAVGIARARDIANRARLSPDTVKRMSSYFARHEVDKQGTGWKPGEDGFPSNGRIAWALWGGDPGRRWADDKLAQIKSIEAENK